MDTPINAQDVIGRDPFGRFLFNLKLQPWQAALASLVIFSMYTFVLPAIFGVLLPREGLDRSSLTDRTNLIGFLVIHPVVMLFYAWQPKAIVNLYRLVLPIAPASDQNGLLGSARDLHAAARIWVVSALVGAGVMYLGAVYSFKYLGERWYSYNYLMLVILQLSRFILFYMIITVLARHLTMAFNLNRVYQHVKLPVLIGESKYAASFDAITTYGLWFAGFGAALGLMIAMRFVFSVLVIPEDPLYLTLYLILVPLSFSLPFWQAHANMRASRQDAINRISDALQDEYDHLMLDISADGRLDKGSEQIETLRAMLELTEKAPTWPYENWALYRLLAATLSPFVMTGIGVLLDWLI